AMAALAAEREAGGPFAMMEDVFRRAPAGSLNRRQVEALAQAGAFDALEPHRAQVFASAELLLSVAESAARERASGQGGLFGAEGDEQPDLRLVEAAPWNRAEQMAAEREAFGF